VGTKSLLGGGELFGWPFRQFQGCAFGGSFFACGLDLFGLSSIVTILLYI